MRTIILSDKECALIYKAIEHTDFGIMSEHGTALSVRTKVLDGAIAYTKEATDDKTDR